MSPYEFPTDCICVAGGRRKSTGAPGGRAYHRIALVMEQEGVDVRAAASRMSVTMSQVRAEIEPMADLKLSDLYRWERALNVPAADFLKEPDAGLSPAVAIRGRLLKAMKTVKSIQVRVDDPELQALSMRLARQLTDLMPELSDVPAWPVQGNPRTSDELGAVVEKQLPHDFFDLPHDL